MAHAAVRKGWFYWSFNEERANEGSSTTQYAGSAVESNTLTRAGSNDIGFAERTAQALQKHQELFPMVEKFLEEANVPFVWIIALCAILPKPVVSVSPAYYPCHDLEFARQTIKPDCAGAN
jgi:hypothetical protein